MSDAVRGGCDVVVVGAGVIGCACALALAGEGARVLVVDPGEAGAEASRAAAGILGAQAEAHTPGPFAELCLASRAAYPAWEERIRAATGLDPELRTCGVLRVARDAAALEGLVRETRWQVERGLDVEVLDARAVAEREPQVAREMAGAVRFPRDGRVNPATLVRAVALAATRAGVAFRTGVSAQRIEAPSGRAAAVVLDDGTRVETRWAIVAAGSWSSLVPGVPLEEGAVQPARGQMVELLAEAPPLASVVFGPGCYLVPRDDGRVLVGSTMEMVGYRREVTAAGVSDLLSAAILLAPALRGATLTRTWAGLRPRTADAMPLIGPTSIEGVVLATGHFRNGILLAPITARLVAGVVAGRRAEILLEPFAAVRVGHG